MSWRYTLCLVFLWSVARAQESHPSHWSYEGSQGPKNWGKLDPAYATCAGGHAQSPIDIQHAKPAELPPLGLTTVLCRSTSSTMVTRFK